MVTVNKINSKIYQFKVIDTSVRNFHGCVFPVKEGSSYNCYLILDDKITLIDLVDDIYFKPVFQKIQAMIGNALIDNVIVNHVEPDHSGGYEILKKVYPDIKTYTSKAGERAMQHHFFGNHVYTKVGLGDTINTGEYTFAFFETPLVHWPDNMWTYLVEEQMLFSNDAFGQLIVDEVAYDDEVGLDKVLDFSKEYYANIIWPCNQNVKRALAKFYEQNWPIKLILPSHGIIIKEYINEMIAQYEGFVANLTKRKAVIAYESMWGNSKKMALIYAAKLNDKGYDVQIFQISKTRISLIMKELIDAELLVVGSGNYNNCVLPPVADFLERVKAANFVDRKALVFGSYGWAKVPLQNLVERLEGANFKVIAPPYYILYVPDEVEINLLEEQIDSLNL